MLHLTEFERLRQSIVKALATQQHLDEAADKKLNADQIPGLKKPPQTEDFSDEDLR